MPLWIPQFYLGVFGLITLIGGVIGYVRARSVASLVAGGVSGLLLIAAALTMAAHLGLGSIVGLVVSVALLGRFAPALARGTRMPALYMVPLAVLGLIASVLLLLARWG